MKGVNNEAWVTSAVTSTEARNALVLCWSLKATYTSRKLVIVTSPTLPENLRDALRHSFDQLCYLEEDRKPNCLKLKEFAKLSVIGLCEGFHRCIYISPNSIAMQNADSLFEDDTKELPTTEERLILSSFMVKPALMHYKYLLAELRRQSEDGLDGGNSLTLGLWLEGRFPDLMVMTLPKLSVNFPGSKTYSVNAGEDNFILDDERKISLVSLLEEIEPVWRSGTLGAVEEQVATHWMGLFRGHVEPILEKSLFPLTWKNPQQRQGSEPIAVIGMSCRLPSCQNINDFWNLLVAGGDVTSAPPSFRWKGNECSRAFSDCKINAGFLPSPVDEFDANFFGISPKEATFMDPQQRVLLEVVWEALEDAFIDPVSLRDSPGSVFVGSWTEDYKDILRHFGNDEFFRFYLGNFISAAGARISHFLNLTGPAMGTEAGCASSMVAVHLACNALRLGQTNLALAAGVNLMLNPFDNSWMPMVISKDGHCKTFCETTDGYARAEGCGVLVLKRLSDALRNGDNIWALIKGTATSQEGISNSLGAPTIRGETLAMTRALKDAAVNPENVSYIEVHGSGTPVGDPIEIAAIAKAYHTEKRLEPLIIGSVKTNIGHAESCSGIAGIIKTILAMRNGMIPPHINLKKLNPAIDFKAIPAEIPLKLMPWPVKEGSPRRAGVSSFGLSGCDAHVILEESPKLISTRSLKFSPAQFERPRSILKVAARSEEALEDLLNQIQRMAKLDNSSRLQDICYAGNTGRTDFNYRAVIIAESKEELVNNLQNQKFMKGEISSEKGKICFLFTGQGSQYPEMAKQLYETSATFRIHIDHCEGILRNRYNINIRNALWTKSIKNELNRTLFSQTSIFVVEYSLLKLLESWGLRADYSLGHSLGEFCAAVCANILSVEDALMLVAERSKLIDALPEGKMLVVRGNKEQVNSLLESYYEKLNSKPRLEFAAVNSNEQTVIAGDSDDVIHFAEFCKNNEIKCAHLGATHAFHSRHMDPVLDEYRNVTSRICNTQKVGSCKFISGMEGKILEAAEVNSDYWVDHARKAVHFLQASEEAVKLGCRIFIEIGPQPVLSALTAINNGDANLVCYPTLKRTEDDWTCLLHTLGSLYLQGIPIDWEGFDQFYTRKKIRNLPHYPFQRKKFWTENMIGSGFSIHPLLGTPIPNASSSKLFQSTIQLASHEYLRDHVVGKYTIFPGSAYLEMCLAAGLAGLSPDSRALMKATHPIKVENLAIKAPLQLSDSRKIFLQTVVETGNRVASAPDGDDRTTRISIFNRTFSSELQENSFTLHSEATFSQSPTSEDISVPSDVVEEFKNLQQEEGSTELAEQFYNHLASVGLHFGSSFKSIEKIWMGQNGKSAMAKIKIPPQTRNQYVVHPVALDAMIQVNLLLQFATNQKLKLMLPVNIGKLVWLAEEADNEDIFVYASTTSRSEELPSIDSFLLNGNGKVIAVMSEIQLVETNFKRLQEILEPEDKPMPDMWEEVWRPTLGHMQHRIDLESSNSEKDHYYDEKFILEMADKYSRLDTEAEIIFEKLNKLAYYNILRALLKCGLELPDKGSSIGRKDILKCLAAQKEFDGLLGYYTEVLVEKGILEMNLDSYNSDQYIVSEKVPSMEEILDTLSSLEYTIDLTRKFPSTSILSELGENLSDILKGKRSALQILFPDGENRYLPMASFYNEFNELFRLPSLISVALVKWLENVSTNQSKNPSEKIIFRILEIGAGTGSLTRCILEVLDKLGIEFEYTFTDLSPAFFPAAQENFQKWGKWMHFTKLNIEEDPLEQGFIPEYFDYICGENVVHATKSIRESLCNVGMLLRPGGRLDLVEMTKVNSIITYLLGVLDGYWRFEDTELRQRNCAISAKEWKFVLEQEGFQMLAEFPCAPVSNHSFICSRKSTSPKIIRSHENRLNKPLWILFHQEDSLLSKFLLENIPVKTGRQLMVVVPGNSLTIIGRNATVRRDVEEDFASLMRAVMENDSSPEGILYCWTLDATATSQECILQPYFYLAKSLLAIAQETGSRLMSFFNGICPVDGHTLQNIHQSTVCGLARSLPSECSDLCCRCIDIGGCDEDPSGMVQVFHEIWDWNEEFTHVAFRDNIRYVPKLQMHPGVFQDLKIPTTSTRFRLALPESRSIDDLQFFPFEECKLAENEVEIEVKAAALNFRDLMVVLKPSHQFMDMNGIGTDISGVVTQVGGGVRKWSVGDIVFAWNTNDTPLHSHVTLHEDDVYAMGDNISWCDAATLPVAFLTAYLGLVEVANIGKGDTVLVHSASGGVGLLAIQICQMVGATVICTAGSNRKRNYLRSLGILHVFNSRDTDYCKEIAEITGGSGVNVVLNSLTSKGFKEATLQCCAKGARFVEMSKLNTWSSEDVRNLRPDVEYTVIDVLTVERHCIRRMMNILVQLLREKKIIPLPYDLYDWANIREALKHLQSTHHIGKVVCTMPQLNRAERGLQVNFQLFHSKASYLITGGRVGSIGFVICRWMLEKGAKHILLATRRIPTEKAQKEILQLNQDYSAKVVAVQLDVGDYSQCQEVLRSGIAEMGYPPLRGVMHCAGALNDGFVKNQNWKGFSIPLRTKVDGALNLHELTKNQNLEHFVLFSSITSLIGNPGQGNYTAANRFEDIIAHHRHSLGLPVTTINWGLWSEVGMGSEIDIPGIIPFSAKQGIAALEYALKSHRTQIAFCNFDSLPVLAKRLPQVTSYLDEPIWKSETKPVSNITSVAATSTSDFWQAIDSEEDFTLKLEIVRKAVKTVLKNILKLDVLAEIGAEQNFHDLGVDSLMHMEIENAVRKMLGRRVPINGSAQLRNHDNINDLCSAIINLTGIATPIQKL